MKSGLKKASATLTLMIFSMLFNTGAQLLAAGESAEGGLIPAPMQINGNPQIPSPPGNAVSDTDNVISLAAGSTHSLALTEDGEVWSWGQNQYGQLGMGTFTNLKIPKHVDGLPEISAIAAGAYFSLALTEEGEVFAWGCNDKGQLGNSGNNNQSEPVKISGLSGIVEIEAGFDHAIARKADGAVYVWGDNEHGQLARENLDRSNGPLKVEDSKVSGIKEIAAGGDHCLVRKSDGTLVAWGDNTYGQLGDGTSVSRSTPVAVQGLDDVSHVTGGLVSSMALTEDGKVFSWGHSSYGELGVTGLSNYFVNHPYQINSLSDVKKIDMGFYSSFFLMSDGSVKTCGQNYNGELGDGTNTTRHTPVNVKNLDNVSQIAAGGDHTLALLKNGTVMSWGGNAWGQLGNGYLDESEYSTYPENYLPDICLAGHWNGPAYSDSTPGNGQILHNLDANLEVRFDVDVENAGDFQNIVLKTGNGEEVSIHRSIEDGALVIDPSQSLDSGRSYVLTIGSGSIQDLAGNRNADQMAIHFTT